MSRVPTSDITPTLVIMIASSSSIVVKPDCERALANIGVPQVEAVVEYEVRVVSVRAVAGRRDLELDLHEGRVDQVRLVREDAAGSTPPADDLAGRVERQLRSHGGLPAAALAQGVVLG